MNNQTANVCGQKINQILTELGIKNTCTVNKESEFGDDASVELGAYSITSEEELLGILQEKMEVFILSKASMIEGDRDTPEFPTIDEIATVFNWQT